MDIYEVLLKDADSLKDAEEVDACGLDDFLSPKEVESLSDKFVLPDKIKISTINDLSDFFRIGNETLIHKAEKDLWRINENKKGEVVIERLFDPTTKEPIRV